MVSEADVCSLLTNISPYESPKLTPRSICLHVDTRIIGFEKNEDPNINEYVETNVKRVGWDQYQFQCKKFGIPPIRTIEKCLHGESYLNLAHYIPQSLGTVYAFEILDEQPNINITHIDLTNCPMTETGCISLNDFIRHSKSVEYLDLKNTKIGLMGIENIEHGLFVNQSIKYLNLSGCSLGDKGVIVLARSLNGNDVLKHLDISHNNLCIDCGDALKKIQTATKIEVLNLGWNELYTNEIVGKIFQGLRKSSIKEFNFSWNGLSGSGWIKDLKQAITKNLNLEMLNIENNRLSDVADQMMPGIGRSKSLQCLYLGGNPWTTKDYLSIVKTFAKSTILKILHLGKCTYLTEECVELTINAITKNPDLEIIFKGKILDRPLKEVDFRGILVDRMKSLAMKPKKKKLKKNMGHFFLQLKEKNVEYDGGAFTDWVKEFGAKLDAELISQVVEEFTTDMIIDKRKVREVAVLELCNYYLSRHPIEPPVIVEKKAKKNKKGKKGEKGKNAKEGKEVEKGENAKKGNKAKKGKKK